MSKKREINYCIVGTGFSGTAVFFHLVGNLVKYQKDLHGVNFFTVEPRAENGPGLPYSMNETLPSHLCNNQACKMALMGNDFVNWMSSNKERIVAHYPHLLHITHPSVNLQQWEPDDDAFYPRQLFGIYLQERFLEARCLAEKHGAIVKNLNGFRAIDGYQRGNKFVLLTEGISTREIIRLHDLDKVLISTGHWSPKPALDDELRNETCYLDSPYPASRLNSAVNKKLRSRRAVEIYVQGMGPSAIDAILTAANHGHFLYSAEGHVTGFETDNTDREIKITVASRSGFFPAARGDSIDYEFKYLTEDTYEDLVSVRGENLGLNGVLKLLDEELKEGTNGKVGLEYFFIPKFHNAYEKLKHDAAMPMVNDLVHAIVLKVRRLKFYRHLAPEEKIHYDRFLDTHFIRTAVPIPLINVEKLIALIEADVLRTVTLGYEQRTQWEYNAQNNTAVADGLKGHGATEFDLYIKSSGQDFHLESHPSPLIQELLKRGEIVSYQEKSYRPGGLALDGHDTYRVMKKEPPGNRGTDDESQNISNHLYSLGVPTRFWQNERNFAGAIMEASGWIAEDWTHHFLEKSKETLNLIFETSTS